MCLLVSCICTFGEDIQVLCPFLIGLFCCCSVVKCVPNLDGDILMRNFEAVTKVEEA